MEWRESRSRLCGCVAVRFRRLRRWCSSTNIAFKNSRTKEDGKRERKAEKHEPPPPQLPSNTPSNALPILPALLSKLQRILNFHTLHCLRHLFQFLQRHS